MTNAPNLPTLKEISGIVINAFTTKLKSGYALLKKSILKAFSWAFAGSNMLLWKYLSWMFRQVFPQTASLPYLILWGYLADVDYEYGKKTVLKVEADDVTASYILTGTVYKHLESGNIYTVLSTSTPVNGICTFNVEAKKTGTGGNIDIGELLELTNPLDGIPAKAKVIDVAVEGTEDEDVEVYRARVLARFRRKAQGGSFMDYRDWCLEVPGVVDALPYCLKEGTVSVYLVGDGSGKNRTPSGSVTPNPFPEWENGQMKTLSGSGHFYNAATSINGTGDALNTRRPATSKVELLTPVFKGFKVVISGLTPNNKTVINGIKQAIFDYLDKKRPHIIAIGYTEQDAQINSNTLNGEIQNIVNAYKGSYSSFKLLNSEDEEISEYYLGIGELAYLNKLSINGSDIEC